MNSGFVLDTTYVETADGTNIMCKVFNMHNIQNFIVCKMHQAVYLLVRRAVLSRTMGQIVKLVNGNPSFMDGDKLEVVLFDQILKKYSNAGMQTYMAEMSLESPAEMVVCFKFTSADTKVLVSIKNKLRSLSTLNSGVYMLVPRDANMELQLGLYFNYETIETTRDHIKFAKPTRNKLNFDPSSYYSFITHDNVIFKFIENRESIMNINTVVKHALRVYIHIDWAGDEIYTITICIDGVFSILFFRGCEVPQPELAAEEYANCMVVKCNDEANLIEKFLIFYCTNGIFKTLHAILNSPADELFLRIYDRIFYNKLWEKFNLYYNVKDKVQFPLLHGHSFSIPKINMVDSVCTNPLFTLIKNALNPVAFKQKLSLRRNEILFKYSVFDFAHGTAEYKDGQQISIESPMITCLKNAKLINEKIITLGECSVDCQFMATARLPLFILNIIPNAHLHELLLFYFYFDRGCVLIPSKLPDALQAYMHIPDTPAYMLQTTEYSTLKGLYDQTMVYPAYFRTNMGNLKAGGLLYSSSSVVKGEQIVCMDFSQFYPSIVSAFGLNYHNAAVLSGGEVSVLVSLFRKAGGVLNPRHVYNYNNYERVENLDMIESSEVYVVIVPEMTELVAGVPSFHKIMEAYVTGSSGGSRKKFFNSMIGNLGSKRFKYRSIQLLYVVHFLGRRIMSLIAAHLSTLDFSHDRKNFYKSFDPMVCSVCTDSITFKCPRGESEGFIRALEDAVNRDFGDFFRFKVAFQTDFLVDILPNKYIYRASNGFKFIGCRDVCDDLLQNMYTGTSVIDIRCITKSNFQLYVLYCIFRSKNVSTSLANLYRDKQQLQSDQFFIRLFSGMSTSVKTKLLKHMLEDLVDVPYIATVYPLLR